MDFKEYMLNGETFLVLSEGTLRPEDMADMYAAIVQEYCNFQGIELPENTASYFNGEDPAEVVDFIMDEAEEILNSEDMYITTAEGDGACFLLCDASYEEEE